MSNRRLHGFLIFLDILFAVIFSCFIILCSSQMIKAQEVTNSIIIEGPESVMISDYFEIIIKNPEKISKEASNGVWEILDEKMKTVATMPYEANASSLKMQQSFRKSENTFIYERNEQQNFKIRLIIKDSAGKTIGESNILQIRPVMPVFRIPRLAGWSGKIQGQAIKLQKTIKKPDYTITGEYNLDFCNRFPSLNITKRKTINETDKENVKNLKEPAPLGFKSKGAMHLTIYDFRGVYLVKTGSFRKGEKSLDLQGFFEKGDVAFEINAHTVVKGKKEIAGKSFSSINKEIQRMLKSIKIIKGGNAGESIWESSEINKSDEATEKSSYKPETAILKDTETQKKNEMRIENMTNEKVKKDNKLKEKNEASGNRKTKTEKYESKTQSTASTQEKANKEKKGDIKVNKKIQSKSNMAEFQSSSQAKETQKIKSNTAMKKLKATKNQTALESIVSPGKQQDEQDNQTKTDVKDIKREHITVPKATNVMNGRLTHAEDLCMQGKLKEAADYINNISKSDPEAVKAVKKVISREAERTGWASFTRRDFSNSVENLELAKKLDPENKDISKKIDQVKRGQKNWEEMNKIAPVLESLIKAKKLQPAYNLLLKIQELDKDMPGVSEIRIKMMDLYYVNQKEFLKFWKEYQARTNELCDVKDWEGVIKLGRKALERELSGLESGVLNIIRNAETQIEDQKKTWAAYLKLKEEYARGDYSTAVMAGRAGIELRSYLAIFGMKDPRYNDILCLLEKVERASRGNLESGNSLTQSNETLNNPDYFFKRGIDKGASGDHQGAVDDFAQAIRLGGNYAATYYNRGYNHLNLGEYLISIQDFTQAIRLNSTYAEAYLGRGDARFRNGDYTGAIEDFTQYISLKEDNAEAYNFRGVTKECVGDVNGAIKDYAKAVKIKPGYEEAIRNLTRANKTSKMFSSTRNNQNEKKTGLRNDEQEKAGVFAETNPAKDTDFIKSVKSSSVSTTKQKASSISEKSSETKVSSEFIKGKSDGKSDSSEGWYAKIKNDTTNKEEIKRKASDVLSTVYSRKPFEHCFRFIVWNQNSKSVYVSIFHSKNKVRFVKEVRAGEFGYWDIPIWAWFNKSHTDSINLKKSAGFNAFKREIHAAKAFNGDGIISSLKIKGVPQDDLMLVFEKTGFLVSKKRINSNFLHKKAS